MSDYKAGIRYAIKGEVDKMTDYDRARESKEKRIAKLVKYANRARSGK